MRLEHISVVLRERICSALAWLGVELDPGANDRNDSTISTDTSRVRVVVEPTKTDESCAGPGLTVPGGLTIPTVTGVPPS